MTNTRFQRALALVVRIVCVPHFVCHALFARWVDTLQTLILTMGIVARGLDFQDKLNLLLQQFLQMDIEIWCRHARARSGRKKTSILLYVV